MSIKLMSKVWESAYAKKTSARLLVMLKLADRADDEGGSCFPAQSTIADACGLARQTVNEIIKDLEKDGKLNITHTQKQNLYQLSFDYLDNPSVTLDDSGKIPVSSQVTPSVVSGDSAVSSQVTQYIIDTSVIHQEECIQEKKSSRPKKPSSPKDERSARPIILAVKELMNRYPDKLLWDKLIARFGDDFDPTKLRECREAWLERGYNANATTWLNWYFDGIPTRQTPKPETQSYNYVRNQPTQREAIEAEQRMIAEMREQ